MLVAIVAACDVGSNSRPIPSVGQIGADLNCTAADHPFEDNQVGWGFCYPGTWRYIEKANSTASPSGLDLTFDITNDAPCITASAPAGETPPTLSCPSDRGQFAFMIVSTYDRGDSPSLASWIQANLQPAPTVQQIQWGNAVEAGRFDDGRRVALTPHHVVILALHSGNGNLDLESFMSSRLGTWKFSY